MADNGTKLNDALPHLASTAVVYTRVQPFTNMTGKLGVKKVQNNVSK